MNVEILALCQSDHAGGFIIFDIIRLCRTEQNLLLIRQLFGIHFCNFKLCRIGKDPDIAAAGGQGDVVADNVAVLNKGSCIGDVLKGLAGQRCLKMFRIPGKALRKQIGLALRCLIGEVGDIDRVAEGFIGLLITRCPDSFQLGYGCIGVVKVGIIVRIPKPLISELIACLLIKLQLSNQIRIIVQGCRLGLTGHIYKIRIISGGDIISVSVLLHLTQGPVILVKCIGFRDQRPCCNGLAFFGRRRIGKIHIIIIIDIGTIGIL